MVTSGFGEMTSVKIVCSYKRKKCYICDKNQRTALVSINNDYSVGHVAIKNDLSNGNICYIFLLLTAMHQYRLLFYY